MADARKVVDSGIQVEVGLLAAGKGGLGLFALFAIEVQHPEGAFHCLDLVAGDDLVGFAQRAHDAEGRVDELRLRDAQATSALLLDVCGDDAKVPLLPGKVDPHVKTLSIAAIYGAAELHLLTDTSPNFGETWAFLEREVETVRQAARTTSSFPGLSPASLVMSLLMRR